MDNPALSTLVFRPTPHHASLSRRERYFNSTVAFWVFNFIPLSRTLSLPLVSCSIYNGRMAELTQPFIDPPPPDNFGTIDPRNPSKTVVLAKNGNLILNVSSMIRVSIRIRYKVHSAALARNSVIFNRMFGKDSPWYDAESLWPFPRKTMEVTLGHDSHVMGHIFRVLHGIDSQIPQSLSTNQLLQATIICDKYWLHEALWKVSTSWVNHGKWESDHLPIEWLFISWTFGPEDIFASTSKSLILDGNFAIYSPVRRRSTFSYNGLPRSALVCNMGVRGYNITFKNKKLLEEIPEKVTSKLKN
jgi:hypothetical protein